ncbi:DEAD-box ATP-dependent RNA helicase CshB [Jeotgalicoccus saudimassiliensis]|uniref:DEAD-box ATP-dependent RNA helicase CshB n=1 Tax=Jeotgalicoccus saudimassiliensis TaxID=1461582 RepID=A0A078M1B3_9STAP|nr:DEAD/DEAH box helicase [Jeotgalicoccus saudimassiliensis]CEA00005.1 DEAD-box ATP-dependent RNA helicase CshB [Jeotgalicoccus saudimassiliensis]
MSNAFKRFEFNNTMLDTIGRIGFTHPTMVQERVIPRILKGSNVVAQSATGSGKSHAFLLPLIYNIDETQKTPQVIVMAPTRELAKQLEGMAKKVLESYEEISCRAFIGGTEMKRDEERARQNPQLVIGTPTRIKDLIDNQALDIHAAKTVVIDEADLMVDLGFMADVDYISNRISTASQFLVFSATIPEPLKHFMEKYIGETEIIVIDTPLNKASIHYSLVPVKGTGRLEKTLQLTQNITPYIGLIFANSRERADELFAYLKEAGVNVGLFHGGLKPRERSQEIKKIENLDYHWVVASDLAARGLDFDGASHVINYDIPKQIEFFTHRVGRVGRGSYSGVAITLYEPSEENEIDTLEEKGYVFNHEDIRGGELKSIKDRTMRAGRSKRSKTNKSQNYKVRAPKKVKPGYKKKIKFQKEELERQERRRYAKAKSRNEKKRNKKDNK